MLASILLREAQSSSSALMALIKNIGKTTPKAVAARIIM